MKIVEGANEIWDGFFRKWRIIPVWQIHVGDVVVSAWNSRDAAELALRRGGQ